MLGLLFDIIQFIQFYPLVQALGQSLIHILDILTQWHFHSTSNEVISNFMHGLKSAILAIFQKWLEW